jgi:hypothetical protein
MSSQSIHQFAEKVAAVGDISHPMGRAAAFQLALLGAFVIAGEPADTDGETVAEMVSLGTLAGSAKLAGDENDGEKLTAAAGQRFGRIDLLLVCEKIGDDVENAFERVRRIVAAAEPLMNQRPKPKIVRCFSTYAFSDERRRGVDIAAREYSERTAAEFASKFRVNTIVVHEDETEEQDGVLELRPRSSVAWDDAARVAVYLLSSEAAALNAQCLIIK